MIESILNYFEISQNAERIRAELNHEVNGQITYIAGAARTIAKAGSIYAVAVLLAIMTVTIVTILLYVGLSLYLGTLGALAVLSALFAIATITAIVVAQNKIAQLPVYRPMNTPAFYKPAERPVSVAQSPPLSEKKSATPNYTGNSENNLNVAQGETSHWMMGLFREGYSKKLNTNIPAVDSFIATMQPDAEELARRGLNSVTEKLRVGSRSTVATILMGGFITGFLLSNRGVVKPRKGL